jgi:hypothetical protein
MLSPEQIRALPAGPKLDRLVAERVMGWRVFELEEMMHDGNTPRPHCLVMPHGLQVFRESGDLSWFLPSSNIAAAWEAVEALSARDCCLLLETNGPQWFALFTFNDGHDTGSFAAPAAPEAICRAALAAPEARKRGTPQEG